MASETDRVLSALEASTRVTTEAMGQIKGLARELVAVKGSQERGFDDMRETFRLQLDNITDEMRGTSAHLDNLIREQAVTNTILQEDMATRQAAEAERRSVEKDEREWRRKVEQEEREWRRKLEERQLNRKDQVADDTRSFLRKIVSEAWLLGKQPLGYLVVGLVFYFLVWKIGLPMPVVSGIVQGISPQVERVAPAPAIEPVKP